MKEDFYTIIFLLINKRENNAAIFKVKMDSSISVPGVAGIDTLSGIGSI
ncbi:MAG: hypothetical protein RBQ72_08060 [Desulfobacterium sp.]|jgi:hypothetical protein|nr:hypothetical protein [Desulfobacterium sp.]